MITALQLAPSFHFDIPYTRDAGKAAQECFENVRLAQGDKCRFDRRYCNPMSPRGQASAVFDGRGDDELPAGSDL